MHISATQGGSWVTTAGVGTGGAVANPMGDLSDVFRIADTLTENDKKLVDWNPDSGKINRAAIALAGYRHSGALTGEVSTDFVDAIKKSIAKSGGYPVNPASLMSKAGQSNPLSPETASALFAILGQRGDSVSSRQGPP